jgi:hypothetical protein
MNNATGTTPNTRVSDTNRSHSVALRSISEGLVGVRQGLEVHALDDLPIQGQQGNLKRVSSSTSRAPSESPVSSFFTV